MKAQDNFGQFQLYPTPTPTPTQPTTLQQLQQIYLKKNKTKGSELCQISSFNRLSSTLSSESAPTGEQSSFPECQNLLVEEQQSFKSVAVAYIHLYSFMHTNIIILVCLAVYSSPDEVEFKQNTITVMAVAWQLLAICANEFHHTTRIGCCWIKARARYLTVQIFMIGVADFIWIGYHWWMIRLGWYLLALLLFDAVFLFKLLKLAQLQQLLDKELRESIEMEKPEMDELSDLN